MVFFFYDGNWNSGACGDYLFVGEALAAGCVMVIADNRPADYQFKAIVKDMDAAYQELLLDHITRIKGVTGVHSSFVLRRVVDRAVLPMGQDRRY